MNLATDTVRVTAEAGMCDGSVFYAHQAIDTAAEAGCWGFKVQILTPEWLASDRATRYDRLGGSVAKQRDHFMSQLLPRASWAEIRAHAVEAGLEFYASCWDLPAVELCETLGVGFYKVGSADINYETLIRELGRTGKPVFLSTGGSSLHEVDQAISWLPGTTWVIPMACTLNYPAESAEAFYGRIPMLKAVLYDLDRVATVGYSDHTREIYTAYEAVLAGATWLEKHLTVRPGTGGDHNLALTGPQMAAYISNARYAHDLLWPIPGLPFGPMKCELVARRDARRCLRASKRIAAGDPIKVGYGAADNAMWQRPDAPDIGIPPYEQYPTVAAEALEAGDPIPRIWRH